MIGLPNPDSRSMFRRSSIRAHCSAIRHPPFVRPSLTRAHHRHGIGAAHGGARRLGERHPIGARNRMAWLHLPIRRRRPVEPLVRTLGEPARVLSGAVHRKELVRCIPCSRLTRRRWTSPAVGAVGGMTPRGNYAPDRAYLGEVGTTVRDVVVQEPRRARTVTWLGAQDRRPEPVQLEVWCVRPG